jgi:molybdopterin molybdotransferase
MLRSIRPDHALELVLEHTKPGPAKALPCSATSGLVLAETIKRKEFEDHPFGGQDLMPGSVVSGQVVGLLTSSGRAQVRVIDRPKMAIVTIGNDYSGALEGRDESASTGAMLAAFAQQAGLEKPCCLDAFDTVDDLSFVMDHVSMMDVIVLVGGVEGDLLERTMEVIGASTVFSTIAQDPGGSMLLATRGARLLIGIPSDPKAALICFEYYTYPALLKMMGRSVEETSFSGDLASSVQVEADDTKFVLTATSRKNGGFVVEPLIEGKPIGLANSLLQLRPGSYELPGGSRVNVQWLAQCH